MKKQNKGKKNKWVKWGVIPLLLFGLWLGLTLWYIVIFDKSALVLSYNHPPDNFKSITHERLIKGEKLSGEFVGQDENLGIVAMRFKSFQRIPYNQEDTLIFKLKEKGSREWYYENEYRSGLTYDVPFLPFGFPIIPDSKGKIYYFELESLNGNMVNGVALSERQPFLSSKYQANKTLLLNNFDKFAEFTFKKFFNSFNTVDIAYSSFVFALPFLFYLFWVSPIRKHIVDSPVAALRRKVNHVGDRMFGESYIKILRTSEKVLSYSFILFVLLVILVDILLLQILNDLLYIVVIFLWIVLFRVYKLGSRYTFLVGLFFLAVAPIFVQLNILNVAEKAGAWAFIFFVTGFIQIVREQINNR